MKLWVSGVGLLLVVAIATSGCASGGATASRRFDSAEMINPRLGPSWAQYLVGPLSRVATDAEIEEFLALADDTAAEQFAQQFWSRRDPRPERTGNALRELFDQRAREADRRFSQAGYLGRRTDRGTIWVLHGEPDDMDFEPNPRGYGDLIEVWRYEPKPDRVHLNGRAADAMYRFLQAGDLKVFYSAPAARTPVGRRF